MAVKTYRASFEVTTSVKLVEFGFYAESPALARQHALHLAKDPGLFPKGATVRVVKHVRMTDAAIDALNALAKQS